MIKREEIQIRDPYVLSDNGYFYLYGTTDNPAWDAKAQGFKCYKSKDLENFKDLGYVFKNDGSFWADENFWAPEVHFYDGKYYMFATFFKEGQCRASGILIADRPEGPFSPHTPKITPEDWECLDATLFVDSSGTPYVVYCHEWKQIKDGTICIQQLSKDLKQTVSSPKVLFAASEAPWTIGFHGGNYVTDGPFFHRLSDGRLCMLWSSIGAKRYALGVSISENGVFGPWRQMKEPLFAENGGHGMLFRKGTELFVALHSPNEPHGEERPIFMPIYEMQDPLVPLALLR